MIYNVNDNRIKLDQCFFESDEFGNIHVFKVGTMEYVDLIKIDYKYNHDEFISICKEWLLNNNI